MWMSIMACLLLAGLIAVVLNEERRLGKTVQQADELEFWLAARDVDKDGRCHTKWFRVCAISDRESIRSIADSIEFEPASAWKGIFYLGYDSEADFTIRIKRRGQETGTLRLFGRCEGLRWRPEYGIEAGIRLPWLREVLHMMRGPMNDDVQMHPRFAEALIPAFYASLPNERDVPERDRYSHYCALAWTKEPRAIERLAAQIPRASARERLWIARVLARDEPLIGQDVVPLMALARDTDPEVRLQGAIGDAHL